MDAELAALIEEQKKQAQMLKDLGLLDEEEETQEQEEEQAELAELDQMLKEPEPIKAEPKEEIQEPCKAIQNENFDELTRIELVIYSRNPKDKIEPQTVIKSASGRTFIDLGNRVFATKSVDNVEELTRDLLDFAVKKGWNGFTIKGASSYAEVYSEAFKQAIERGLALLPDPVTKQAQIAIDAAREFRKQGEAGKAKAAAYARLAMDNASTDARKEERKNLIERMKSALIKYS